MSGEGRTDDIGEPFVPDLISVRIPQAVRMTGLSRSRIYELIRSGEIEASKVGRQTVVIVASLRALILSRRKSPRGR